MASLTEQYYFYDGARNNVVICAFFIGNMIPVTKL